MADDTYVQQIRYEADISDIQSKLDRLAGKQSEAENKTTTSTSKMSGAWDRVGGSVKKVGLFMAGLGGAALLAAPKVLEAGASLEGLDAKASTVFEGSLGAVNDWAAANASAMGLTNSQARDAAAAMADLLKPMGFNADQAADMSTSMIDLSGALSAWTGGSRSAAEVSEILSKAMLGERDGLKELGISISEADVQARLAKNGQADLTGAALEQAKALATQQLILEKSTDAQTAWSDGSMDAAKEQNKMKAATAQLGESFNRALYPALKSILPVVTTVADWLGRNAPAAIETLKTAIGAVADWFSSHKEIMIGTAIALGVVLTGLFISWAAGATAAAVATLAAAAPFIAIGAAIAAVVAAVIWAYENWEIFRVAVQAVRDFIVDKLVPAFQAIWSFIQDKIMPIVKTLIEAYLKVLVTYFGVVRSAIMDYVIPAFQAIISKIQDVATIVGQSVDAIVGFIVGISERIAAPVRYMFTGISTAITTVKDWVKDRIEDIVGFATGLPGRMAGLFSGMWNGIKEAFRSTLNWVIDKWNGLEFKVPSFSAFGKSIGGWTIGVPDIPKLAAGGLAYSPTLAVVGDNPGARNDPEVVAPLSKLTDMLRSALRDAGGMTGGTVTLIVEGEPITARIVAHERAQVATLMAGTR